LFRQLLDVLDVYATFEINEESGEARTDSEMTAIHYDQITSLQVRVISQVLASVSSKVGQINE